MKLMIGLLAAAGLSGCVAYPAGYAGGYYGNGAASYSSEPAYVYGGYSRGYRNEGRGFRDRDRDGVPNRYDRDRDGDGVPNRADDAPNNPRRR